MKVGLIDVDNWAWVQSCGLINKSIFPNLPLMKLSAWHKSRGDAVSWYNSDSFYDVVYMSKVFSFSKDVTEPGNTRKVIKGGSGYAISLVNGKEVYDKTQDPPLDYEIEHTYPDYDLYGIKDTAYGFMQRGCSRACDFCHVKDMQGTHPKKTADLSEFWNGQKKIVLLDPNIAATKEWRDIFQQLIDSGASVDFSQGLDIRLMTPEKAEMLKHIKVKNVHFAWDRYDDGEIIKRKLTEFKDITGWGRHKVSVYVLCNFDTSLEQDIERIMSIRELNFQPYVMRYDKAHIARGATVNALARWVNFVPLFRKYETFEDYLKDNRKHEFRN